MGLIRTIFILIIGYYLFRFLFRIIVPLVGFVHASRRAQRQDTPARRPEGEVRVENAANTRSDVRRDEGEYVDFEEIR